MKSYFELVQETLDQRAIIDNRNIVVLGDVNKSVLIAFNQACEFMRDLQNWKWNKREIEYINDPGQDTFPMPYGIVQDVFFKKLSDNKKCQMTFVEDLWADKGCPSQWTHKWDTEEIQIAPAASADCDDVSETIIKYNDRNLACIGARTDGNLIPRFELDNPEIPTDQQFLNVPEYIYDSYARCVILMTRVFLNENAQMTVFDAQKDEWNKAYNGLMSYAKTPFYTSERTEI